jgi:ATP phosphoribosyltransferase
MKRNAPSTSTEANGSSSDTQKRQRQRSDSIASAGTYQDEIAEGGKLLFAIPKKGRLHKKCMSILEGAGVHFIRQARLDIADSTNLNVRLVFLPAHDIAQYVSTGNVDLGITGQDVVRETENCDVTQEMLLGFGKCRLAVEAPVGQYTDPTALVGKRIVTSFPKIAKEYFDALEAKVNGSESKSTTRINTVSGSVEAACALGLADAVVDLVETGTTMRAAGLECVSTILETECVLISNNHKSEHKMLISRLSKRIKGYLTACKYHMIMYNVQRKDLGAAKAITPGVQAPTVMALDNRDWVAVSALVPVKEASTKMDQLEGIGATGIIVMELSNCRN